MSNPIRIIIMIIFGLTLLLILIRCMRRNRLNRENKQYVKNRMREEALDRALANPASADKMEAFEQVRRPFQVEYSAQEQKLAAGRNTGQMYELTEVTELSRRKYMYRCEEPVFIGSQAGTITILPVDCREDQIYGQIFYYSGSNYLRSTGKQEIVLKRKDKQVIVTTNGIKLQSGDQFKLSAGHGESGAKVVAATVFMVEFIK